MGTRSMVHNSEARAVVIFQTAAIPAVAGEIGT